MMPSSCSFLSRSKANMMFAILADHDHQQWISLNLSCFQYILLLNAVYVLDPL